MSGPESILVTGAAGFIGSNVCDLLLRRGVYATMWARQQEAVRREAALAAD